MLLKIFSFFVEIDQEKTQEKAVASFCQKSGDFFVWIADENSPVGGILFREGRSPRAEGLIHYIAGGGRVCFVGPRKW